MRKRLPQFIPDDFTKIDRAFLAAVFVLHFALALFFVFAIPLYDGPDENGHFAYVKQLATEHQLPQLVGKVEMVDRRTGAIGAHPPLAYVLGTPVYAATQFWGDKVAGHALRIEATLWSGITLALCWLLLCQNFPDHKRLNLAAITFAALLPHYVLLSSVWNSDGLLILLSTLFVWRLIALTKEPTQESSTTRDWLWMGVLWGCLLLTKATALMYVAPVFLVLVWQALRKTRSLPSSLVSFLSFVIPGVLIGGWWSLRSYLRTGAIHPVPDLNYQNVLLKSPFDLILDPNAPILIGRFLAGAMRS
ncbi:DUF2142 domain-containing protein, partial [bacterium]